MTKLQKAVCGIVSKAAFCAMDFNTELKGGYVGCCYDVWASDYRRTGIDSTEKDEFCAQVQQALNTLGFNW